MPVTGVYVVAGSDGFLDYSWLFPGGLAVGILGTCLIARRWWSAVLVLGLYVPVLAWLWFVTGVSVGCLLGLPSSCL